MLDAMHFNIDPAIFQKEPELKIGILHLPRILVPEFHETLHNHLALLKEEIRTKYTLESLATDPKI